MIRRRALSPILALLACLALLTGLLPQRAARAAEPQPKTPIKHFIVLMQENHTFDNYFGTYPGADGIPEGVCMPVDPSDAAGECIEPFHIGNRPIEDLDHSTATALNQYNGGKMDGFIWALRLRNQEGSLAMGYYDGRDLPYYWNLVDQYVLFDRFFSSAMGGSVWNHMYWVAAQPGSEENRIPPEGYGDDVVTIFDRLEERGISWKFYIQNYDPTITFRTMGQGGQRAAQVVWCPLLNFPRFIDNPELFSHIVPLDEYFTDLQNGTLPSVAYIVPSGASEHPPGSIRAGQRFVKSLIQALMRSDAWYSSAFMVTYDDWGGWYDHVPPPQVDEYGYGFRVPAFLVSPYAKRGYIDHTELDFTSILKFIEENWGLEPLAERDARANSIINAFDFSQPPRPPVFIPEERVSDEQRSSPRRGVIYSAYGMGLVLAGSVIGWAALDSRRQRSADPVYPLRRLTRRRRRSMPKRSRGAPDE